MNGRNAQAIGSLVTLFSHMHDVRLSIASRSVLWMFARTVPEPSGDDYAEDVARATFQKEYQAATTPFHRHPQLDYSNFLNDTRPYFDTYAQLDYDVCHRTASSFATGLNRLQIQYPRVQRRKNVSWETGELYCQFAPGIPSQIRTVDLEVLYGKQGIQIGGQSEIRTAWRFNDLKPRSYYCQGGTMYWPSRYMRGFAVKLMEAIPSTMMHRRLNPQDYLEQETAADYLVTWDYESFTSRLSELKFFLSELCKALRERAIHEMRVLDYRQGIVCLDPVEMIEHYNEHVNTGAGFSIHRVVDRYMVDTGVYDAVMENSGQLGVAGNIGFSTALHGFHACRVCGLDRCSCVGDDAIASTAEHPNDYLIPEMQKLGSVHPEKFSMLYPDDEGPLRYLKRAMFRYSDNTLFLTSLLDFPLAPYIDGETGSRTVRDKEQMSTYNRVKRTAISAGRVLDEIQKLGDSLTDNDLEITTIFLREVYWRMRMPFRGCLPGYYCKDHDLEYKFCIPPIPSKGFDPRCTDWLEEVFSRVDQPFYEIPILMDQVAVQKPCVGDLLWAPSYRYWNVLEDMGWVRLKRMYERVTALNERNRATLRRSVRKIIDKMIIVVEIECIAVIPDTFDELFVNDPNQGVWLGHMEI